MQNPRCLRLWTTRFDYETPSDLWVQAIAACKHDYLLDRLAVKITKVILKTDGFSALARLFLLLARIPFAELSSYLQAFGAGLAQQDLEVVAAACQAVCGLVPSNLEDAHGTTMRNLYKIAAPSITLSGKRRSAFTQRVGSDEVVESAHCQNAFARWLNSEHIVADCPADLICVYETHMHRLFLVPGFWRRYLYLLQFSQEKEKLAEVFSRHSALIFALKFSKQSTVRCF